MTMRAVFSITLVACAEPATSSTTANHDACGGVVVEQPILDSPHVPVGSPIVWPSNPPTSGPHWPVWAGWDRDYAVIPRGYWLHNAEHGGVVFAYRCDAGCPDVADQLDTVVRGLPDDPHCDPPLRSRALIVRDSLLPDDRTVVAVAWGVYYTATCVDADALAGFAAANGGRATENTCADGGFTDGTPLE